MKNFDMESFSNDLISCDILNGSQDNDDISWERWKLAHTDICDRHAPMTSLRLKKRSNPWMTHDIIKLMYERDYVHAMATQSNDSKLWQDYRNLRNKVTCIIKERKMPISMISIPFAEMTPKKCGRKYNDWYLVRINTRILLVTFLRMISIAILPILARK